MQILLDTTLYQTVTVYQNVLYTHRQRDILLQFAYGRMQANIRWFYMPQTYRPLVIYISTNSYVIIFWIRPNVREYSAIWYIEHWYFACKTTAAFGISMCGIDHNTCRNICGSYNLRTAILVQISSYVIQMKYLDAQINSFNNASDFTNHWMDCIPMIPS